jgi:hypothetical protein
MRVKEVLTSSPHDLFVCFLKGTSQLVEVLCHMILMLWLVANQPGVLPQYHPSCGTLLVNYQ